MSDVSTRPVSDDEIDLRELVQTIWDRRLLVAAVTVIAGMGGWLYGLLATPIYEAKATVEIGYTIDENGKKSVLDDGTRLAQELNIIFIELPGKTQRGRIAWVEQVGETKGNRSFIEMTVRGFEYTKLADEINLVVAYAQEKHRDAIGDFVDQKRSQLEGLDRKIAAYEQEAATLKIRIAQADQAVRQARQGEAALAALALIEKRGLEDRLSVLHIEKIDLELERTKLRQIVSLKPEDSRLITAYVKNTGIVGEIVTNDRPVSPKKQLMVAVAFVAGLMVSIFLVFLIEFVKGFKKEQKPAR